MTHQQYCLKRQFSRPLTIAIAAALIMGGIFAANVVFAQPRPHKGADELMIVEVGTNPARCGNPDNNVELHFEGTGVDTLLGFFTSIASACQDISTGTVSDLVAEEGNEKGDAIIVRADPFPLILDAATCIASIPTNQAPGQYIVEGVAGDFTGWSGSGEFEIYAYDPVCDGKGQVTPHAFVSFTGTFQPN
jgi:hypothetical protein